MRTPTSSWSIPAPVPHRGAMDQPRAPPWDSRNTPNPPSKGSIAPPKAPQSPAPPHNLPAHHPVLDRAPCAPLPSTLRLRSGQALDPRPPTALGAGARSGRRSPHASGRLRWWLRDPCAHVAGMGQGSEGPARGVARAQDRKGGVMTLQWHASDGLRLRRCGCASWSRSTPPPNPRRDTRRKRHRSSHANRRKDKPEEGCMSLTKWAPEFPLDLRAKTLKEAFNLTIEATVEHFLTDASWHYALNVPPWRRACAPRPSSGTSVRRR